MAYSELVKNFNKIREYMREFYVFGFKTREEFTQKSARSYDNERRRVASWLGDYMRFRRTPEGKNVFLSIDSRFTGRNPLFKALKTKSFTDGDITLHFLIFDILYTPEISMSLEEITEQIDEYLSEFEGHRVYDQSTVRKKLAEYVSRGLICTQRSGRKVLYSRCADIPLPDRNCLDFFSEAAPLGAVGSFLLDRQPEQQGNFVFKHHYITSVMDSDVVCDLFRAMGQKRFVSLEVINRLKSKLGERTVVPLKIMISVQSGRQYLMAALPERSRIVSLRTDSIVSVTPGEVCPEFERFRGQLMNMSKHLWGVSSQSSSGKRMERVEFTVRIASDEKHILHRLNREKRCGTVEMLDETTARFSAEVYDAEELVPWIRTYICRITSLNFSNKELENRFRADLDEMYEAYGLKEVIRNDFQ